MLPGPLPASIHLLDLFGTAVFALTGALRAITHRLDLMGAVVLGVVTALGGGMVRDALLGRHPPAAFADQAYLIIAAVTAFLTFFWGRRLNEQEGWIIAFDALGLGVFTLVGAYVADQSGLGAVGILFIAMLTATGGGVLRAVLVTEVPFILRKEIYASASFLGAALYLLLPQLGIDGQPMFWAVVIVTTGVRLGSWRLGLHLPQS
ncbi:MAG TPA: trimeric intracellular cation channel family protein [Mariprofundaceae bacterium]|nr:trimeric intracellular cation channel family protein [Mariprofundaceae bacterium]